MKNDIVLNLQKKYTKGGYALVSPRSGKIAAYGRDIKKLYDLIRKKGIHDEDKVVMHIPSSKVIHVFKISLPVRKSR